MSLPASTASTASQPPQSCLWIHKIHKHFFFSFFYFYPTFIPFFLLFLFRFNHPSLLLLRLSLSTYLALVCVQWLLLLLPVPTIFSVFTVPRKTFPERLARENHFGGA
jgi:hypothetical protein